MYCSSTSTARKMESTGSINMDHDFPSTSNLHQRDSDPARCCQQNEFDLKYGRIDKPPATLSSFAKGIGKRCKPSRSCFVSGILDLFPIVKLVKSYRLKEYALGDIVAGLSVGVMTVPLSMGYALLASVPPICGLYTSCFPPIMYLLFGAAPYVGIGVMALSSLMIGTVVERETAHLEEQLLNAAENDTAQLEKLLQQEQIAVATSVTLISGLVAILMSFLKLGFITSYLSGALVSGFFTGSNIRVITHQVRLILGVHVNSHTGPLNYFYMVWDMLRHIKQTNIAQVVISVLCCVVLILVKKCINERFRSRLKVPVPIDFIVIIIVTAVSHFANFEDQFGVRVVKEVPSGVPAPIVPSLNSFFDLLIDGIALAIVCYSMIYMMAKLFSTRHNLEVYPNQDLFAMAMCNIMGSFFSCFAASSSPPRCFIMEATGGRTQVAFFVSSLVVLLFLFFLAPLLESLPVCVLACLIVVACIPLFEHYKASVYYWRSSMYDFAVYMITLLSILIFDISYGLLFGVCASIFTVILRTQHPYVTTLSNSTERDVLLDSKKYSFIKDIPGVVVFRFEAPLYFATVEIFKEKLYAASVKPAAIKSLMKARALEAARQKNGKHYDKISEKKIGGDDINTINETVKNEPGPLSANGEEANDASVEMSFINGQTPAPQIAEVEVVLIDKTDPSLKLLIIDCSSIPFIDTAGGRTLASVCSEFKSIEVTLVLAHCTETVREMLHRLPECKAIVDESLYVSVLDALHVKVPKTKS